MNPSPLSHAVQTRHARPADIPQITSLHRRVQVSLSTLNRTQELGPIPDEYVVSAVSASRCYVLVVVESSHGSSSHPALPSGSSLPSPAKPTDRIIGRAFLKPPLPVGGLTQIYPRICEVPDVYSKLREKIEDGQFSFLHSVMIDPQWQGKGYGGLFMRELVRMRGGEGAEGREGAGRSGGVGAETMVLDCWAGNMKLRAFYSGLEGWEFVGEVPEETWEVAVFCFRPASPCGPEVE